MTSRCIVSGPDYRKYFDGGTAAEPAVGDWNGVERRVGATDRRRNTHDRRWEAEAGRRMRLADRRQAGRTLKTVTPAQPA